MAKKTDTKNTAKDFSSRKDEKKGNIYVTSSFNNTIVSVTDINGNVLGWSSSGNAGFKGTRKSTPFAATSAVEKVIKKVKEETGISEVSIYLKGPGAGRDAALRAVRAAGMSISMIADATPVPHNGPRPKKKKKG